MHKLKATTIALFCIVAVLTLPAPVAAEPLSGTVTVANGTADGDRVTITPIDQNYRRTGDPVNTTVEGTSFSVDEVPDAPLYFVRVVHNESAHYALVDNSTDVDISLSSKVSGQIVAENGTAMEETRIQIASSYGPIVTEDRTGENGTFSVGPLKPNSTYYLRYGIGGVPYNHTIKTDAEGDSYRLVASDPTNDTSNLSASGGTPASHVVQLVAPRNGSRPTAVETLSLQNDGDRPFVGQVELQLPEGVNASGAMYQGKRVPVDQDGRTAKINATIPPGERSRVGVAYPIEDRTLERTPQYDPDVLAVSFQGYDLANVEHSENLERGDSPVPILVMNSSAENNETFTVELPANGTTQTDSQSGEEIEDDDGTVPLDDAPVVPLLVGLVGAVGGGILAYRAL
ncbi:hypothetical protein SAMN04487948_101614 [Halogranum amylolyticum]|uniref:Uncharacterized protein n=1 Tax=Halogranum amylolyticum TaxID=660520 RepID=A0A1H8NKK9_9EURY|nr:hypothetical protein [Halogranum amylolyticum]SEO30039.1 hypothetical protein SAMN04487948_101614 [Halogranum amylolyticum]